MTLIRLILFSFLFCSIVVLMWHPNFSFMECMKNYLQYLTLIFILIYTGDTDRLLDISDQSPIHNIDSAISLDPV